MTVPVACPMPRSETVYDGHPRAKKKAFNLQVQWSATHDNLVPKLMVRGKDLADQVWTSDPCGLRSAQAVGQLGNCLRSRERARCVPNGKTGG